MNIFIADIKENTALLGEEESWHCARVMRMKAGEEITIIDGSGHFYQAALETISDKKCTARVLSGPTLQKERPYQLHLAIAPTKQMERIEWFVEKAVEIGIDTISFFVAKHSERKTLNTERIRKIVVSAVKQSVQAKVPVVNELVLFKEMLTVNADRKFIAHCHNLPRQELFNADFRNHSSLIVIGPEGDFTSEEIEMASTKGFIAVSLGTNRLRTETAALYAVQTASILSMRG